MNEHIPTRQECREATEDAFNERYESGEWLEDLNEHDMRDLLRQMWARRIATETDVHANDALLAKFFGITELLDNQADALCQRYADEHFGEFLKVPA